MQFCFSVPRIRSPFNPKIDDDLKIPYRNWRPKCWGIIRLFNTLTARQNSKVKLDWDNFFFFTLSLSPLKVEDRKIIRIDRAIYDSSIKFYPCKHDRSREHYDAFMMRMHHAWKYFIWCGKAEGSKKVIACLNFWVTISLNWWTENAYDLWRVSFKNRFFFFFFKLNNYHGWYN